MNSTKKNVTVRKQKIRKNHIRGKLLFFSALVVILLIAAALARHLCPYDPYAQDLLQAQKPPSAEHLMGTDRYGRDLFSRVLVGSTTSVYATLILVAIITVAGTVIGIICGWCGGVIDTVLMRISDLFLAFPSLVFALAVAGVLGGGIQNAIIALAVIGWPKFARLARGLTLAQKDSPSAVITTTINGAFVLQTIQLIVAERQTIAPTEMSISPSTRMYAIGSIMNTSAR